MRCIAVINEKGGVGKTTTACNLSAALAGAGFRTLAIDLDPQAHLTVHLGVNPNEQSASIYEILVHEASAAESVLTVRNNLGLIPAKRQLANAESDLATVVGREVVLRDALEPIQDQFDFIVLDCPPSLGVLTINGLAVSTEVNIPLEPHFLALQGMSELFKTVSLVQRRINPDLKIAGVILCKYERSTKLATEVVDDLRSFLESGRGTNTPWADAVLYNTTIRRNIKLAECPSYGKSIFDYEPRCNGAEDYANFAKEVITQAMPAAPVPQEQQQTTSQEPAPQEAPMQASAAAPAPAPAPQPVPENGEPRPIKLSLPNSSIANSA